MAVIKMKCRANRNAQMIWHRRRHTRSIFEANGHHAWLIARAASRPWRHFAWCRRLGDSISKASSLMAFVKAIDAMSEAEPFISLPMSSSEAKSFLSHGREVRLMICSSYEAARCSAISAWPINMARNLTLAAMMSVALRAHHNEHGSCIAATSAMWHHDSSPAIMSNYPKPHLCSAHRFDIGEMMAYLEAYDWRRKSILLISEWSREIEMARYLHFAYCWPAVIPYVDELFKFIISILVMMWGHYLMRFKLIVFQAALIISRLRK